MMSRAIAVVIGAVLGTAGLGRAVAADLSTEPWTPAQGVDVLARAGDREPFIGSREARRHPESLYRFFRHADYRDLRGNPVFGYWSEGTFRWQGTRVAFDGITAVAASARSITRRAWAAAFAYVAKKRGLVIDRHAPIRIRGACVGAVLDPSVEEPNRGVVLEIKIEGPTGTFRYRFGMGKPTLEDAVGASLDWAIGFGLTINRDPAVPAAGSP